MAAYEVLLLNTAIPQIQAAQSGDTYVVPRDIAFSAALTLSAGTANGVPYLNGSKVLTTGSALTFNGTELGTTSTGLNINNANALVRYQNGSGTRTGYLQVRADAFDIWSDQAAVPMVFGVANSEQMRLTSTGLGIGTSSPTTKLHVEGGAGNAWARFTNTANTSGLYVGTSSGGEAIVYQQGNNYLAFFTNALERLRLSADGNLGLEVTPSAWGGGYKGFQVTSTGALASNGSNGTVIGHNFYYNGTNDKYLTSGAASRVFQFNGGIRFDLAPSGTAGNAISFTQAMTLNASGQLLIGTTGASGNALIVNGTTRSMQQGVRNTLAFQIDNTNGAVAWAQQNLIGHYYTGSQDAISIRVPSSVSANTGSYDILGDGTHIWYAAGGSNNTGSTATERARITSGGIFQVSSGGSVQVGGTAARATTAGTNRLDIFNGTAPVGTLTDGISIYSSSGEAYVMDAAGNATLFSPHDAETNEWIFKSKHTPTGKVLKIDVERLLKFVNDHFGLDAVHEFVEE